MRNGTKALSIAIAMGVVVIAIAMVGTSAFTSSTIDRDVSIGVTADNSAIVDFMVGGSDVARFVDGELEINVDNLNMDAIFTFGNADATEIVNDYAFAFVNTDDSAHDLTFSTADLGDDVTFTAYTIDGATLTPANGASIASGATVYVVMTVDTSDWALADTAEGTVTITLA